MAAVKPGGIKARSLRDKQRATAERAERVEKEAREKAAGGRPRGAVAGAKKVGGKGDGAKKGGAAEGGLGGGLSVGGTAISADAANGDVSDNAGGGGAGESGEGGGSGDWYKERLLKPLPDFGSTELRDLAAAIQRDIFLENPNVRWDDIAGLTDAKRLLKEAVVMPMRYPQLFTGLLTPWKGVLLYGPPGTGKTLLAKAVASECQTTFFNISASSIVSKWRGDSEKLVRVLFALARHHAPSTVFIDELDAIMSARDGGDHEASRRMKTELLIQMDGLAKGAEEGSGQVFVLGATNLPWDLDMAMLRRLEKRVHVPLPDAAARRTMLSHLLSQHACAEDVDAGGLADATAGYSGADVMLTCKEAAMRPLRRLLVQLEMDGDAVLPSAGPADVPAVPPLTADDVAKAIASTKPSASAKALLQRYHDWASEFGSNGS